MINDLSQLLFVIASALLLPVIVALLLLAAWSLLNLGGVIAEWIDRRRHRPSFARVIERLKSEPDWYPSLEDIPRDFNLVRTALAYPIDSHEKTLDDLQLDFEQAIASLQIGVRLGPVLGLVGTLIPLGPALMALSSGNIHALSQQLIVAFSTTVLGLTIGGLKYVIATIRRSWYNRDLSDVGFLLGRVAKASGDCE